MKHFCMHLLYLLAISLSLPLPAMAAQGSGSGQGGGYFWALLLLLAMIVGLLVVRRFIGKSKLARLNRFFLNNPQSIAQQENEFFILMSQLAGKPAKFFDLRQQAEQWGQFQQAQPGNKYGLFASSLLKATLAANAARERMFDEDEALEFVQQSQQEADKVLAKLDVEQRSFLNLALAQAYMGLLAISNEQQRKDRYFALVADSMLNSLSGDLKVYQMANILASLGQAYQNMAKFKEKQRPYLQQGFDYLSMAIALSPQNRDAILAMNQFCAYWAGQEQQAEVKEKLLAISRECRLGRYQQLPFDKDLWLARLAATMNREKTCRDKLNEMLAAQEKLLFAAMQNDHYLDKYRDKPWFQQTMQQAAQFR